MSRIRIVIGIVLFLVVSLFFVGATTYTDFLWFVSLGFERVFLTSWVYRLAVGFGFGLATFVILAGNIWLAKRLSPNIHYMSHRLELERLLQQARTLLDRYFGLLAYTGSAVIALLVGLSMGAFWKDWLRFVFSSPSGSSDPVFGRDLAFYFFTVPIVEILRDYFLFIFLVSFTFAAFIHLVRGSFNLGQGLKAVYPKAKVHLSMLAGLIFVVLAVHWWLSQFRLLYSPRGSVFGAGYTDVYVQLPAYRILIFVTLVTALLVVLNGWLQRWVLPLAGIAAIALIWVVGTLALPAIVQQYFVAPNEIVKESPFISKSIKFTRQAFGLDKVERRPFPVAEKLSREALEQNRSTIESLRLWDWRPLKKTYSQIQEIRLYYNFRDVDLDRYVIDGDYRQIALSARELVTDQLPEAARSWINQHLVYTHGYGLVASPVNEIAGEGLPELLVKNIPPKSTVKNLEVKRPQIYFGEATDDYAIIGTKTKEFDYPAGDTNRYRAYTGKDGVRLRSYLTKMAFAYRFGTAKLMLSGSLTPKSRVLFHRNITERLQMIAPFLTYDPDPYMVVEKGRLFWIVDAYTMTDRYPYAKPAMNGQNYVRNSVKAVIDAYEGTVDLYVVDKKDPLIRAYSKAFPGVFKPLARLDKGLLAHIRYPEALFKVQAEVYSAFHMSDPQVFFGKEDLWDFPKELYDNQTVVMDPYYTVMKLPGEEKSEFALILPFTPTNKNNMISWLAARSDPPNYGKLLLYTFPKEKLVFGPMQVESRLDQEPEISRQLSLWNQRGSRVIRGNLLVVPVADAIMYVEPIYLQAEASELPELKRVAVGLGDKVVMEPTIDKALDSLLGGKQPAKPTPETGRKGEKPVGKQELIKRAAEAFDKGEEAQRSGDWAEYGRRMKTLKDTLEELAKD